MGLVEKWVEVYLQRFDFPEPRTAEEQGAGQFTLLLLLLIGVWIPVFVGVYALLGLPKASLATLGLGFVLLAGPIIYRRTGSVRLLVRILLGAMSIASIAVSLMTGGIRSPVLFWPSSFPLVATLLVGVREGTNWLALLTGMAFAIGFAPLLGLGLGGQITEPGHTWLTLFAFSSTGANMLFVAWGINRVRSTILKEVYETRAQAVAAHRQIRLLLDSVREGLILVDGGGRLRGEHSVQALNILGPFEVGESIWSVIARVDGAFATWLERAWPCLSDPLASFELASSQLPSRLCIKDEIFLVKYHAIRTNGDDLEGVVMTLSDISAEERVELAERGHRELHRLAARAIQDPLGVRAFMEEGNYLIAEIQAPGVGRDTRLRAVHTLKGNALLVGLDRFGSFCHDAESALDRGPNAETAIERLVLEWNGLEPTIRTLVGDRQRSDLDVSDTEYADLLDAIEAERPHSELAEMAGRWRGEQVVPRLERLASLARALADQIGKGPIQVEVRASINRVFGDFGPFWGALVHIVRNSVDHGLESPQERELCGKPPNGRLRLEAEPVPDGGFRVVISDDGNGIDFIALRRRASERGLPTFDMSDEELLFEHGLSSRTQISHLSGRGVGTAAVRDVVQKLGGTVCVRSTLGEGTSFEFTFPPRVTMTASSPAHRTLSHA